jgi:hypothetical protein
VVTSLSLQSHELRYYLYWMLLLVSLNLILWTPRFPMAVGWVAASACAIVVLGTAARYVWPSGDSFNELLQSKVDRDLLEGARSGQRLCIAREPWTFLYAPMFHPSMGPYAVQEATADAECAR